MIIILFRKVRRPVITAVTKSLLRTLHESVSRKKMEIVRLVCQRVEINLSTFTDIEARAWEDSIISLECWYYNYLQLLQQIETRNVQGDLRRQLVALKRLVSCAQVMFRGGIAQFSCGVLNS